jgi:hypothetical protein
MRELINYNGIKYRCSDHWHAIIIEDYICRRVPQYFINPILNAKQQSKFTIIIIQQSTANQPTYKNYLDPQIDKKDFINLLLMYENELIWKNKDAKKDIYQRQIKINFYKDYVGDGSKPFQEMRKLLNKFRCGEVNLT